MKPSNPISIMKFGGSSFATPTHFGSVCRRLRQHLQERGPGARIICVASAPPGLTEQYREALLELNPAPSDRLIDAGLPLADSVGAVRLAAAAQAFGMTATVALGHRIGLRTDTNYTRARLQSVVLTPLRLLLDEHRIVVVPGGQAAAAETGETTWLGKNSSDFSAIALAAAFDCEELEIYSDVPGVFTSDPNMVPSAWAIPRLPHAQAIEMSLSGAKVLHHRAVAHAQRHGLRIVCRRNHGAFDIGTVLEPEGGFHAAVVPDTRSQTFIGERWAIDAAAGYLASADVPHYVLHGNEAREDRLVVTCGFFDAWRFLVIQRGLELSREDTRLLSLVRPDGSVTRELTPAAELAGRARALHDRHCRMGEEDTGTTAAPVLEMAGEA